MKSYVEMQLIFCKDKEVQRKNERYLSYFLHIGVIRITDLCLQLKYRHYEITYFYSTIVLSDIHLGTSHSKLLK